MTQCQDQDSVKTVVKEKENDEIISLFRRQIKSGLSVSINP